MNSRFSTIQKCAFAFALLFLAVYSLDFVPGVMDANGKMFGLFSMTTFVDLGHLGLGMLALISGFVDSRKFPCFQPVTIVIERKMKPWKELHLKKITAS